MGQEKKHMTLLEIVHMITPMQHIKSLSKAQLQMHTDSTALFLQVGGWLRSRVTNVSPVPLSYTLVVEIALFFLEQNLF